MDLRKLHYFVKVADAGSFRRASEMLNIAQPALTRQIQALEADLGVPLLFRSKSGVTLTSQGGLLVAEAREILIRTDMLRELVKPGRGQPRGEVRLGLPSALADMFFGMVVERTRARYPDIQIICREGAADLIENVESGSLDLAIVSIISRRATYQCHLEHLGREQDYLITLKQDSPADPFISIEDLLSLPLVLTPRPNARRQNLERLASKQGTTLNIVAEATTMTSQLNCVLRGLGCAVLPLSAAQPMARANAVQIIPIAKLYSHRALLRSATSDNPVASEVVAKELRWIFSRPDWRSSGIPGYD
nr:LysR family transcriptional regulator [Salinicola acroporae]